MVRLNSEQIDITHLETFKMLTLRPSNQRTVYNLTSKKILLVNMSNMKFSFIKMLPLVTPTGLPLNSMMILLRVLRSLRRLIFK